MEFKEFFTMFNTAMALYLVMLCAVVVVNKAVSKIMSKIKK